MVPSDVMISKIGSSGSDSGANANFFSISVVSSFICSFDSPFFDWLLPQELTRKGTIINNVIILLFIISLACFLYLWLLQI